MATVAKTPTIQRLELGSRLRAYRERLGLTGEQVARKVSRSAAWLSYVENGESGLRPEMLAVLFGEYQITDEAERQELLDLAIGGRQRGWWSKDAGVLSKQYRSFLGYEDGASEERVFEAVAVHGLLQTEEYARLVTRAASPGDTDEAIDRRVKVRLARQQRLLGDNPLQLLAVLDEAVLHRVIGGDIDVHRRQLDHLIALAADTSTYPNVRIQIVPFSHAAYVGQLAGFTILEFPGDRPEIVYIETENGALWEEPPESRKYRVAHDDLRAAALGPAQSIERMEQVRNGPALNRGRHDRAYATEQDEVGEEQP